MKYLRRMLSGALVLTLTCAPAAFAQDACPLPAGVANNPLATPGTTAAQVEAGTANVRDFALDARNYMASVQIGAELAHAACVIREEGPWMSGSTYIVTISTDGRVFFHSAKAALSGRPLKLAVWREIATAAGVAALRTTGRFGIPDGGALPAQIGGGYAVGFRRTGGNPLVIVTGLDIGEAHLAPETVDPGEPEVRADEVVDRATLKAFVDGATEHLISLFRADGRSAFTKVKSVFRNPNGPWRHGPIYLFIMEPTGYTIFHGAFPDRFEFQRPTNTLRDEVTGQLILPQIIQVARDNPGGGYLKYYFDNPDDDTDSATVPKVTYVRQHVFQAERPDGSPFIYPLIFGAGIYGDPVSEQSQSATKDWLARFGRTVASQAVDMIGDRLTTPSSGDSRLTVGGHTLSPDLFQSWQTRGSRHFAASQSSESLAGDGLWKEGTSRLYAPSSGYSVNDLFLRSSFYLPVASDGNNPGAGNGRWAVWGQAAWTEFDGGSGMSSEGDVKTGMLGVDYEKGSMLSGLAVSRSWGDGDFEADAGERSDIEASLTSIFPYLRYAVNERLSVWGLAGYGEGSMWLDEDAIDKSVKTDIEMNMGALGIRGELQSASETGRSFDLAVKSDVFFSRVESDSNDGLESIDSDARRVRLGLEGSRETELEQGSMLRSSLEVGLRYDGGDADTGAGLELGGGIRYTHPETGLIMEANARGLVAHAESDYDEWGFGASIQLKPGPSQRGLSLTLTPSWGVVSSGVQGLWSQADMMSMAAYNNTDLKGHLDAELAYGMGALGGQGLLTSYAAFELSESNPLRLGTRLNVGSFFVLSLEGVHYKNIHDSDVSEHELMLQSTLHW